MTFLEDVKQVAEGGKGLEEILGSLSNRQKLGQRLISKKFKVELNIGNRQGAWTIYVLHCKGKAGIAPQPLDPDSPAVAVHKRLLDDNVDYLFMTPTGFRLSFLLNTSEMAYNAGVIGRGVLAREYSPLWPLRVLTGAFLMSGGNALGYRVAGNEGGFIGAAVGTVAAEVIYKILKPAIANAVTQKKLEETVMTMSGSDKYLYGRKAAELLMYYLK